MRQKIVLNTNFYCILTRGIELGREKNSLKKNGNKSEDIELKTISLFSGALGLDLGLEQTGIKILAALDIDHAACQTIRSNRPELPVLEKDIGAVTGEELIDISGVKKEDIDIIAGGPPCQAFSVFGKRRGTSDPRGQVIFHYLRVISEVRPKAFVMENVRGLLSMRIRPSDEKGSLFALIQDEFEKIGYRTDCFVVNAVNYGAPQLRERIIVIGNRLNRVADFPKPTHSNRPEDNLQPFSTLGEAISNFHDPDPVIMDFSERKKKYLALVPPGGNWRCLPEEIQKESMGKSYYLLGGRSAYWRKLTFDFPCPTIVTMPNHAGTSMCHPTELRTLTVGECAKIQGFPEDWKFEGSAMEKYRLVGNAVPVHLGKMAGIALRNLLIDYKLPKDLLDVPKTRIVHLRPHVRTRWYWKDGKAICPTSYYDSPVGCSASQENQDTLEEWI